MANEPKFLPLLIGLGGILIGAIFIFFGWRLWSDGRELRSEGVTVQATVAKKFRKDEDRSWGGLENYYIVAAFTDAAGRPREVEVKVQSKVSRALSEGGTIEFTWLEGRPETIRVGPLWGRKVRGIVGLVMMVVGAIVLVMFPIGGVRAWLKG